ncbi:MAG TPA: hypothetical protein VHF07_07575, partial [Nitrospiraceae bacterium]|nr:hypothetical protein [Nitrospiraceae bacterium]
IVGAVAQVFIGIVMAVLTAVGYVRWTMGLAIPLVLVALGGHLWSIPVWGPLGAAWTTSIVWFIGASAGYIAVRSLFLIRLRYASMTRAVLFGALGWVVGTAGPGGAAWLLVGLPCAAVLLVLLYGRLEGVMNLEPLLTAARLGKSGGEETR